MAGETSKGGKKASLKQKASQHRPPITIENKQKRGLPAKYIKWLVFAFALALYANTLDLKYASDDSLMITGNEFTKKGISGIKDILTNDAFVGFLGKNNLLPGGRYRPLTQVMFAVEKELFGFNPFVGHLLNIIFYAITCMLLFVILQRLFRNYTANYWYLSIAFIAAILFTAHPLHTEAVANIKGRDEIMSLFFSLLTVWLVLVYLEKQKLWMIILSAVTFIMAILSKENAVTFILIVPLILFVFTKSKKRDHILCLSSLIAAALIYFVFRISMIGLRLGDIKVVELLNDPFTDATFIEKYATVFYTWLKYLGLMIFPHPLTHDYYPKQIPIINFSDVRALLSFLIYTTLLVFALWKIKNKNMYAFGILFFFITFSTVSNFVINVGTFMNERFLFTSLTGFTIIVAYFLAVTLRKKIKNTSTYRTWVIVVLVLVLSAYSIKTVSRNRVWMDDFTLFTTDVKVSANSTKCNTSAGGKLLEKADSNDNEIQKNKYITQSVKYLTKALEIYPKNLNALILLGNAKIKQKEYAASRNCYAACLAYNPKHNHALNNLLHLAQYTYDKDVYDESAKTYTLLLKYQPDIPENYFGLGLAYRGMQKYDSALSFLNHAQKLKPDYVEAISKMGEIYGQDLHNLDSSEAFFQKALTIKPDDESSLENLGIVFGIRRNYEKSLFYFRKALELEPDKHQLYMNIAETYRLMGDMKSYTEYKMKSEQIFNKKQ